MNDLIKITEDNGINTVNARELWEFLESKRKFTDWIKLKVLTNSFFVENEDYVLLHNIVKQSGRGGHNKKEYGLTVNTAKKVAMMEGTKKGDEVREYFLEIERKYRRPVPKLSKKEILQVALSEITRLEDKIETDKPKIDSYNSFLNTKNTQSVNEVAKLLGTGQKRLFRLLRKNRFLYTKSIPFNTDMGIKPQEINLPKQEYIDMGICVLKDTVIKIGRVENVYPQIRFTAKGVEYLKKRFFSEQLNLAE